MKSIFERNNKQNSDTAKTKNKTIQKRILKNYWNISTKFKIDNSSRFIQERKLVFSQGRSRNSLFPRIDVCGINASHQIRLSEASA